MKKLSILQNKIKTTPLISLKTGLFPDMNIMIKREDLNHDIIQGNKWHKLKLNLEHYYKGKYTRIVSFGGAFSNHIYALAGACHILEIPCVIYIRGHKLDEKNPTIAQLLKWNTQIELLDFQSYRKKNDPLFVKSIKELYDNPYIIPEGGSNQLGFEGVIDFGKSLIKELSPIPDYICVAAGTGATAAGIVRAFEELPTEILIFSSLKSMNFNEDLLRNYNLLENKWKVINDFHFGGFAKVNSSLVEYIRNFYKENGFVLDPIYTGKMFYGIYQMLALGYFKPASNICIIHSGGLQGISGFNYLNGNKFGLLPR